MARKKNVGEQDNIKMIELRVRLWTNDIATGSSKKVQPKHAWTSGVVLMGRNNLHGIKPRNPKPFRSLLDLGAVIEKVLIEQGVVLHQSKQMKRYMA